MKTVIVVGRTEVNGYGDLLVTCKDGNVIKIAKKREHLHKLFQQDKAVELDWQNYNNKDYVSDARLVEGALPPPTKPPTDMNPPQAAKPEEVISGQERGMCLKEIGEGIRSGQLEKDFPKSFPRIKTDYYKRVSKGSGIALWDKHGE